MICVLVRLSLAWAVYMVIFKQIRYAFALLYVGIALGSLYQYITKTRKVGAFHNKVWWDYLRPVHVVLFSLTAYGLYVSYLYTYIILLLDTFIGVLGFMRYHL